MEQVGTLPLPTGLTYIYYPNFFIILQKKNTFFFLGDKREDFIIIFGPGPIRKLK